MKRLFKNLLLASLLSLFATSVVLAQFQPGGQITVDEDGRGAYQTLTGISNFFGKLGPDPTGGLLNWPVLIYDLPFAGQAGDVLMRDPLEPGSPILDVLRFDGAGHLIFYSDSIDGYNAPGDTPGPPNPFFNYVFINEQGAEGQIQYGYWLPTLGQAGFDAANPV